MPFFYNRPLWYKLKGKNMVHRTEKILKKNNLRPIEESEVETPHKRRAGKILWCRVVEKILKKNHLQPIEKSKVETPLYESG